MLRDPSHAAMTRRPKLDRGRRNFTLDDLLTDTGTGLANKIALDLASEIVEHFGEMATISQARSFCERKGFSELRRRIECAIEGRNGPDAVRAMAHAMRDFAFERPGLSAVCFRSVFKDFGGWPADDELVLTLSGTFAQLNLTGEQGRRVLRALRIFVHGFCFEEAGLSFAESLEYEKTYELAIRAFVSGLQVFASRISDEEL